MSDDPWFPDQGTIVDVVIPALTALMGGALGAYWASRASTRSQAYVAARLASDGLSWWTDALTLLVDREPDYPRDDSYDVYMAQDLAAVSGYLTMDWWEANRAGLLGVASKDEWAALREAAKASQGLLMLLASIGNVGEEVWMRLAEAHASLTPDAGSRGEPQEAAKSREPGDVRSEAARAMAETRVEAADIERRAEAGVHELRVLKASLDHRLFMVRDVRNSMVSARPKFDTAVEICRSLEEATRRPLGLLAAASAERVVRREAPK